MEASVIKEMDTKEIVEAIRDKELSLTKKRIAHKVNSLENPIEIRKIRRTVARLKTELRTRELIAK